MNKTKVRDIHGLVNTMFCMRPLFDKDDLGYIKNIFAAEINSGTTKEIATELFYAYSQIQEFYYLTANDEDAANDEAKSRLLRYVDNAIIAAYKYECEVWNVEPNI